MGIFDLIKNAVAGTGAGATPQGGNPLVHGVLQMLNDPRTGGLQGLVSTFQAKGLGGIVSSWVGTGANQPISAEQLTSALGAERVQQIAKAANTTASAAMPQLAALLPTIIDKLTPGGSIPEAGALAQGLAALKQSLGAATGATPATPPKS